jgi:c-di-GMP-related signal transduction protein
MDVFIARQPIFDSQLNVFGYELLYRLGTDNFYDGTDGDKATSEVIANTFLLIGLEALTGGKRAFINFTENLLKNELATSLPKEIIVVEVLENIDLNEGTITACAKLKKMGYMLVLDDFVCDPRFKPLLEIVDMIKVDFLQVDPKTRVEIVRKFKGRNIKYLAEKVETREDFEQGLEAGYQYFQGYFFSKPVILSTRDVPANKINYLHVLQETNKPDFDFSKLDNIVKRDVALSYKLLKFINSASFGFKTKITSIKHALVMLGMVEVKKWVSLIALRNIADDKPAEIMTSSIVRARLGELLAPKIGMADKSSELFLMGLFSMIDALIGRPMSAVLADLPITEEIKDALIGRPCRYRDVYELIVSYEKGDWDLFCKCADRLKITRTDIPVLYLQSLEWAGNFLK